MSRIHINDYATIRSEKLYWISAALTLGIGIFLRLYGIDQWPIQGDEYFTITKAYERANGWTNPLGYIMVVASFELFGVSEWSARLPSAILGIIMLPVYFLVALKIGGRRVALIATIFLSIHSWHIYQSQFSRFYTGELLFATLSIYFFCRAYDKGSWTAYVNCLVTLAVAALFQKLAIALFGCYAVFSLFSLWRKTYPNTQSRNIFRTTAILLFSGAIFGVSAAANEIQNWYHSGQTWGAPPFGVLLQLVKTTNLVVVVASLFGTLLLFQRSQNMAIYAICICGIPIVLMIIGASAMSLRPDYVFYVLPVVLMLAAYLCVKAGENASQPLLLIGCVSLLLVVPLALPTLSYFSSKLTYDIRAAVELVKSRLASKDRIVNFENSFKYYFNDDKRLERYKGNPFSDGIDWDTRLELYRNSEFRTWFVVPVRRAPLAAGLKDWLYCNARLVRDYESVGFSYSVEGTQVFITDIHGSICSSADNTGIMEVQK